VDPQNIEFTLRHILVALDGSKQSMAALEMAADLAAVAKAELIGLFVEDTQLLRLAESPQARQVLYPSAKQHPLNRDAMEQQFRAQAELARRAMASLANPIQMRWAFRVVRGEVNAEVLAAAVKMDILVLGRSGWSLTAKTHLGSTALNVARHSPRDLLLVRRCHPLKRQVLVVANSTESFQAPLIAAVRLARAYGGRLIVLTSSAKARSGEGIPKSASTLLKGESEHLHVQFRRMPGSDPLSIAHAVQAEGGGIVVVGESVCSTETLKQLLYRLDTPILLVR
jgi:nucleotide-binding universal stress UspA family protein